MPTCFSKASHVAEMSRHFTVRNHVSHFHSLAYPVSQSCFALAWWRHMWMMNRRRGRNQPNGWGVYTKVGPYHLEMEL